MQGREPSLPKRPSGSSSPAMQSIPPRRVDPRYSVNGQSTMMARRPSQSGREEFGLERVGSSSYGESPISTVHNPMPRLSIKDEVKHLAASGGFNPHAVTKKSEKGALSGKALEVEQQPWNHTPPDKIDNLLWDKITDQETKRVMWEWINENQPPYGFNDDELWEKMPPEFREIFLKIEKDVRHVSVYKSQVTKFFMDPYADDFDFDAGINSFALINALVLTIPYGVCVSLNGEIWSNLKKSLNECPQGSYVEQEGSNEVYQTAHRYICNNAACATYSAISGLILVNWWYLFKAKDKLTRMGRIKQRVHVFLVFMATFCAVVGVLCLFSNIQTYLNVASDDVCRDNTLTSSILRYGLGSLIIALMGGPILMY